MVVLQGSASASTTAAASSPETFARTAILAWTNQLLGRTDGTLSDVPPHDLALILYGIFDSDGRAAAGSPAVSLQNLQFPAHYADQALPPLPPQNGAASTEPLSRALNERNAAHVLSLVQTLSAGMGSPVVLAPTTTAATWLDGKAFVDELRVWRWVRTAALERAVTVDAIREAIRIFLHGPGSVADGTGPYSAQTASINAPLTAETPPLRAVKRARSEDATDMNAEGSDELAARTHHAQPPLSLVAASRQRLQQHGAPGETPTSPSTPATTRQVERTAGEVVRRAEMADEPLRDGATVARALTRTASRLAEAQGQRRAGVESDEAGGGGGGGGGGAVLRSALPPSSAGLVDAAAGSGADGHVALASPCVCVAGIVVPEGTCARCVPVVAQAIQCNVMCIAKLEEARQRAMAACKRKDASALLNALSAVL